MVSSHHRKIPSISRMVQVPKVSKGHQNITTVITSITSIGFLRRRQRARGDHSEFGPRQPPRRRRLRGGLAAAERGTEPRTAALCGGGLPGVNVAAVVLEDSAHGENRVDKCWEPNNQVST